MSKILTRLQPRHLRLIHAIATHGQLSHAANILGMTQPSASRSLAEIERLAGAPLFERHPKGMTPTHVGEILVRHAGVILGDLEAISDELAAVRSGRAGTVRVGAVTGAAVGFVVPAIQDLKRETENPDIRVDVAPSTNLMDGLLGGKYDFVLSRLPEGIDPRLLDIQYSRAEHLDILARKDHPLSGLRHLDLRQLSGFPWIMQAPGMPIRSAVELAHVAIGLTQPRDVIDSASLLVMMAYLRTSDAISPVAREVSELICTSGGEGCRVLDLKSPITMPPYHLIRQSGRPLSPVTQRLFDLVVERLAG
ncbi:LysR family transcriptional regulator [Arenibacterium sp. CAU 1754]